MKKLYILFLFSFGFKVQGSVCEKLNLQDLINSQELLEIQKAYKTLSPLRNETPRTTFEFSLGGYNRKKMPYMQYVSLEEENKQKMELIAAYERLERHGLQDKSKTEIESFLKAKFSQSPITPSFYQILDDDEELNEDSFKEIDEACAFSQEKSKTGNQISSSSASGYFQSQKTKKNEACYAPRACESGTRAVCNSYSQSAKDRDDFDESIYKIIDEACEYSQGKIQLDDHHDKKEQFFEQSLVSTEVSFFNDSEYSQKRNENLSVSSNDFLEDQSSLMQFNSIEDALHVIGLTSKEFDLDSILYKENEYDEDSCYIDPERYNYIKNAIAFLKSKII